MEAHEMKLEDTEATKPQAAPTALFEVEYSITSDKQTVGNRIEIDTTKVKIEDCDIEQFSHLINELSLQYSEIRVGLRLKQ